MTSFIKNLFFFSTLASSHCYAVDYFVDNPIGDVYNPLDLDGSLFMSTYLTTNTRTQTSARTPTSTPTPTSSLTQTITDSTDESLSFFANQLGYASFGVETYFVIGLNVNEPGNTADFITVNALSISVGEIGAEIVIFDLDDLASNPVGGNSVQFNPVDDDPFTTTTTGDAVSFNSGGDLLNIAILIPLSVLTDNNVQINDPMVLNYNISDLSSAADTIMLASDGVTFVTLVPEPSTCMFALIGSTFFLPRRRRN